MEATVEENISSTKERGFNNRAAARTYDRFTKIFPNKKEERLWEKVFRRTGGKKALDMGIGTGFLSNVALRSGLEVVGMDLSPHMLDKAVKNLSKYGSRFTGLVGDAENPDFPDQSFDIVMSRFMLWTLPNPRKMLENAARMLKPGGTLLLSDGTFNYTGSAADKMGEMLHLFFEVVIGWTWPGKKHKMEKYFSSLPLLSREKVLAELKSLNARVDAIHDLGQYQSIIHKMIGTYWHPYLMVVKFP